MWNVDRYYYLDIHTHKFDTIDRYTFKSNTKVLKRTGSACCLH